LGKRCLISEVKLLVVVVEKNVSIPDRFLTTAIQAMNYPAASNGVSTGIFFFIAPRGGEFTPRPPPAD